MSVADIIGDLPYEFMDGMGGISFRRQGQKDTVQFGGALPEKVKPKRHEALYVWRSMFSEL